jgi:hypothetical protein
MMLTEKNVQPFDPLAPELLPNRYRLNGPFELLHLGVRNEDSSAISMFLANTTVAYYATLPLDEIVLRKDYQASGGLPTHEDYEFMLVVEGEIYQNIDCLRQQKPLTAIMVVNNGSTDGTAEWLQEQSCVTFVSYPGLPGDPGHEIAKKQMQNGFGGVISFGLATDDKTVERFCAQLKVITFAVSLGHDESLIFPQPSYDERIGLYPEKFRQGFLRFSVGLEDVEDIIGDLRQAMQKTGLL